ncbi:response regulator [Desulfurispirillum indicum]|uniref:response regulator n=1 Tax=Desulfurispirillum indicum TaxID=936456 RepID=UPI001CFADC8B|nr:response regulator [Desulfurispirillum indicum]UCZ57271.1 response regulator [Desulfurispirillum indicum]
MYSFTSVLSDIPPQQESLCAFHGTYIVDSYSREGTEDIFIAKGDSFTFGCLLSDPGLMHMVSNSFEQWHSTDRRFTLTGFLTSLRYRCMDELHSGHQGIFFLINEKDSNIVLANFSSHRILLSNRSQQIFWSMDQQEDFTNPEALFRVQVCPLQEVESIILCNADDALEIVARNFHRIHLPRHVFELLSSPELPGDTSKLSCIAMNFLSHEAAQHCLHLTQKQFTLEDLSTMEDQLQQTLEELQLPREKIDQATFAFHEVLFNAFEHGILGIGSDRKEELIRQEDYESFLHTQGLQATGTISVSVEVFSTQNLLMIQVEDSGSGFDYQPYTGRARSLSSHTYRGRGIYCVKDYCDGIYYSHSGRKATLLTGMAPVSNLSLDDLRPLSHENTHKGDIRLLLVDDDEGSLELYRRILNRLPMTRTVFVATNGLEGLNTYHQHKPDIIISDIQMPRMTGLEMAHQIRREDTNTPIILLTAYSDRDLILEAIDAGINRFVKKPLEVQQLRRHLEYYAQHIRTRHELQHKIEQEQRQREKEFFALKAKRDHDEQQQRDAFAKEQLIIHNDSALLSGIHCQVHYQPQEILSGDIYGIYRINNQRTFFYIIDSMGKGLSASVTSLLSASHLHTLLQSALATNTFHFTEVAHAYTRHICQYMVKEELISFTFACLDQAENTLEYISCGMYPILVKDSASQTITTARGNNPPFTRHSLPLRSSSLKLPSEYSILLYSDALCESTGYTTENLHDSFARHHHLEDIMADFSRALARFDNGIIPDDISVVLIARTLPE